MAWINTNNQFFEIFDSEADARAFDAEGVVGEVLGQDLEDFQGEWRDDQLNTTSNDVIIPDHPNRANILSYRSSLYGWETTQFTGGASVSSLTTSGVTNGVDVVFSGDTSGVSAAIGTQLQFTIAGVSYTGEVQSLTAESQGTLQVTLREAVTIPTTQNVTVNFQNPQGFPLVRPTLTQL